MAEGHIEVSPSLGHRVGNLEGKWPCSGDAAGICDGAWGRVVSVALGNTRSIDQQAQKAPTITAGIEDPASLEVGVDGVEHRLPNEAVLVLHGLILGGATPIGGTHGGTLRRPRTGTML